MAPKTVDPQDIWKDLGRSLRQVLSVALAASALSCIDFSSAHAQASLRGSRSAMRKENSKADRENLSRIKDGMQLRQFVRSGRLVPIPEHRHIAVDHRVRHSRRYVRPWTAQFLKDLAADFSKEFGGARIRVTSAVRPQADQRRLCRRNANAAAPDGPLASSHSTGATVDIGYKKMSATQRAWTDRYLLRLEQQGLVQVTKEQVQACYHVMVFRNYSKLSAPARHGAR